MTTAPALAARGANTADTLAPGDDSTMSMPLKSKLFELLDVEHIVLAERHLTADRARRGERDDLVAGELALGQRRQHLAPDIAGGADHRYLEAHDATPSGSYMPSKGLTGELRCRPALYKHPRFKPLLHNVPASFEAPTGSPPLVAPQDEEGMWMASRTHLILRRSRSEPRRTQGIDPAVR